MSLKLLLFGALLLFGIYQFCSAEKLSSKIVRTQNGPVQGVLKTSRNPTVNFVSFLGLRFANPTPRFEPAKMLHERWSKTKIANVPGNVCIQPGDVGTDDCLFLNVHIPDSALSDNGYPVKQLPVIFWIHPGGFAYGEGHTFGAEYLMENEDVILVTTNFRLSVLGFITMETDNVFTANNGLRDIVVALQWVQQNIASFGGNPNKITLLGESSGSGAVHYLLMSPLAKGLFHAAGLQSGTYSFWTYAPNPKEQAQRLAKYLGCQNTRRAYEVRKCFEKTSGANLTEAQMKTTGDWPTNIAVSKFLPTAIEPQINPFFADQPGSFFTVHSGRTEYPSKVPVIIGITRDEGSATFATYALAEDENLKKLNGEWNELAPRTFFYNRFVPTDKHDFVSKNLREYYYGSQPVSRNNLDTLIKLYTDSLFTTPVFQAAEDMAKDGMRVWPYIFTYYGKNGGMDKLGANRIPGKVGHADDVQYLFPHPIFGQPLETLADEKFSKEVVKFWTHFAKTGAPIKQFSDKNINWNPISTKNVSKPELQILELGNPANVVLYNLQNGLEFWRKTFKEANGILNDKSEF